MANLENTDYVHETYLNMNREEMQEELKGTSFITIFTTSLRTEVTTANFRMPGW